MRLIVGKYRILVQVLILDKRHTSIMCYMKYIVLRVGMNFHSRNIKLFDAISQFT